MMALRVFFPCTGLGREQRGFEAFTRECADALAPNAGLSITVFGGGGDMRGGERATWNLPRHGVAARVLGRVLSRNSYFVEQATFFAGFVPALVAQRPDLVYFGDLNLGNACWHWRRLSGQRYRLLYYNGGPTTRPFTRCDYVQQVSPEHVQSALVRGERADHQFLLPHALRVERNFAPLSSAAKAALRAELGVPVDGPLILSVGALNTGHKRVDYLIDEVAAMTSQPHLLLLGAETPDTPAIRARAASRLPGRCTISTLPRERARMAYGAADAFVLTSLVEGFGLAQLEALDAGLPCVAHDTPTSAYVLGKHGILGDLRASGALAPLLERALHAQHGAAERHAHAYESFSWDRLAPKYGAILRAAATGVNPASVTG